MSKSRTFAVVLGPEEEDGFTVRVPAFPEIVFTARTSARRWPWRRTPSGL